jgi:hypothetical protein
MFTCICPKENKSFKNFMIFILVGLLTFVMSGCKASNLQEEERSRIYVISFQEYWNQLERKASEWHSDAYLIGVTVPILIDSPRTNELPLSAYFFSFSDELNMLDVMFDYDGRINVDTSSLTQVLPNREITRSDWKIDSVDALKFLLQDEDVEFLISHSETQCSSLELDRWPQFSFKVVTWRIVISDCGNSDYTRYGYIDALSGKIIEK